VYIHTKCLCVASYCTYLCPLLSLIEVDGDEVSEDVDSDKKVNYDGDKEVDEKINEEIDSNGNGGSGSDSNEEVDVNATQSTVSQ
jgi:hypothetical protein